MHVTGKADDFMLKTYQLRVDNKG